MTGRLPASALALYGVLALSTTVSATLCEFSVTQRLAPHTLWKGRIGNRRVVTLQDIGARGEPNERGGGVFWTGAICTPSGRAIGNVLLRLPDAGSSSASGSFLIAPNRRRPPHLCDVSQLTHASLGDQVLQNRITGACADGRIIALEVKRVWSTCAAAPSACVPVQTTDVGSMTTTTLRCPGPVE